MVRLRVHSSKCQRCEQRDTGATGNQTQLVGAGAAGEYVYKYDNITNKTEVGSQDNWQGRMDKKDKYKYLAMGAELIRETTSCIHPAPTSVCVGKRGGDRFQMEGISHSAYLGWGDGVCRAVGMCVCERQRGAKFPYREQQVHTSAGSSSRAAAAASLCRDTSSVAD